MLWKELREKITRERVSIDDMQFDFMPGRGATDAIFLLRQLQEKHVAKNKKFYCAFYCILLIFSMIALVRNLFKKAKNKKFYCAFVDLEKAFDRVPREVIWRAMQKLGVEEWILQFV